MKGSSESRQFSVPPVPRSGPERVEWWEQVRARMVEDAVLTIVEGVAQHGDRDFAAHSVDVGVRAFVEALEADLAEVATTARAA